MTRRPASMVRAGNSRVIWQNSQFIEASWPRCSSVHLLQDIVPSVGQLRRVPPLRCRLLLISTDDLKRRIIDSARIVGRIGPVRARSSRARAEPGQGRTGSNNVYTRLNLDRPEQYNEEALLIKLSVVTCVCLSLGARLCLHL